MPSSYRDPLLLLQAVLLRAEQLDFTARAHLQLSVSLVYRLMGLDPKRVEAYLALAFLFCVIDEWKRAQQILLYANRLMPQNQAIQRFLYQLQAREQPPSTESVPDEQITLPTLQMLQEGLEQVSAESLDQNFAVFRPILAALATRLVKEQDNDK